MSKSLQYQCPRRPPLKGGQESGDKDIPEISQNEDTQTLQEGKSPATGSSLEELSHCVILQAFAEFEHYTCIQFVAYQGQKESIIPMSGCFSGIGNGGGMQVEFLAPACLQKGHGIILHELMHVLGFWHVHVRAD
ncbi:astacin-like metalloendopeptidase [Thomomys bottae]